MRFRFWIVLVVLGFGSVPNQSEAMDFYVGGWANLGVTGSAGNSDLPEFGLLKGTQFAWGFAAEAQLYFLEIPDVGSIGASLGFGFRNGGFGLVVPASSDPSLLTDITVGLGQTSLHIPIALRGLFPLGPGALNVGVGFAFDFRLGGAITVEVFGLSQSVPFNDPTLQDAIAMSFSGFLAFFQLQGGYDLEIVDNLFLTPWLHFSIALNNYYLTSDVEAALAAIGGDDLGIDPTLIDVPIPQENFYNFTLGVSVTYRLSL